MEPFLLVRGVGPIAFPLTGKFGSIRDGSSKSQKAYVRVAYLYLRHLSFPLFPSVANGQAFLGQAGMRNVSASATDGAPMPESVTQNADQTRDFSVESTNASLPGAPKRASAEPGDAQVTVSFEPPTSEGGSAITGYKVISHPDEVTSSGQNNPVTVTGLRIGTAYSFTVEAINGNGTGPASSPSNVVTFATVPGAPANVIATPGDTRATVKFTAPASNGRAISRYTVTSNTGESASGRTSPITVSGLTNGTAYTFTVTAINAVGAGPASSASNSVTLVNWPLRVSANRRYLEDQSGVPFLVNADAGWEMIANLSQSDMLLYLNDRQSKGFTGIEVMLIDDQFSANRPYDNNNDPPFTHLYNWSDFDTNYWRNVDYFITQARNRGMVLFAFPAYTGWCCSNGISGYPPAPDWCTEIDKQSSTAMYNYGQAIGNRYKASAGFGNVIYMMGGDEGQCPNDTTLIKNVAQIASGIKRADPAAMVSVHWGGTKYLSSMDSAYTGDSWLTLNGVYKKSTPGAQATVQLNYQTFAMPLFYLEPCYDDQTSAVSGDCGGDSEDGTTQGITHEAMVSWLGGALSGFIYGEYYVENGISTWSNHLTTPGALAMANIKSLLLSRNWTSLVPDYTNTVLTSSKGSGDSYKATARTSDGATVLIWNPDTSNLPITVDMTQISGSNANVWQWNPADNTAILLGVYPTTTGNTTFSPSAATVLVLDDAGKGYGAPGLVPAAGH